MSLSVSIAIFSRVWPVFSARIVFNFFLIFNIFSATLGASRLHIFLYSKSKTRIDVQRCLVKTFKYIGGVPNEILTDNMSSIVNNQTHTFSKEFIAFTNDMQIKARHCKPRHPYTKGLFESIPKLDEDSDRLIPIEGSISNAADLPTGCYFHPRCRYCKDICKQQQPTQKADGNHKFMCHFDLFGKEAK